MPAKGGMFRKLRSLDKKIQGTPMPAKEAARLSQLLAQAMETLEQVRTCEPVPPVALQPSVPRDLETICLKCLQKDPARRYPSAAAMAEDLDHFLKGEPIRARPVSRVERVWRWCKRNPRIAGLSAAVVLLVIVWAATSSILAWNLKLQTDEAVKNEKEAIKQTGIAKNQTLIAERNAQSAKATAAGAIHQMVSLGKMLYARLQSKRLAQVAGPELAGLRREVLATLRQSLKNVSASIDAAGGTPYGEVGTYHAMGDLLAKLGQGRSSPSLSAGVRIDEEGRRRQTQQRRGPGQLVSHASASRGRAPAAR